MERHERVGKFGPGHARGVPPGAEAMQAEVSAGSKNARRRRGKKKGGDAAERDAGDAEASDQPSPTPGLCSASPVGSCASDLPDLISWLRRSLQSSEEIANIPFKFMGVHCSAPSEARQFSNLQGLHKSATCGLSPSVGLGSLCVRHPSSKDLRQAYLVWRCCLCTLAPLPGRGGQVQG